MRFAGIQCDIDMESTSCEKPWSNLVWHGYAKFYDPRDFRLALLKCHDGLVDIEFGKPPIRKKVMPKPYPLIDHQDEIFFIGMEEL